MRITVVVMLITMLCACGAMPALEKKASSENADKWVGHTIDELIVVYGEPTNVYSLDSGSRIFEYLKMEAPVAKHIRKYAHRSRGIETQEPDLPCKTLVTISSSDVIEKWSAEGEGCK